MEVLVAVDKDTLKEARDTLFAILPDFALKLCTSVREYVSGCTDACARLKFNFVASIAVKREGIKYLKKFTPCD